MAERVGFSNVVHRDCDRCNPDSIPTDGHGKPVFWAKYACTVIIWFSDTVEVTTKDVSNDRALDTPDGPHRLNVDYQSNATTLKVGSRVLLDEI